MSNCCDSPAVYQVAVVVARMLQLVKAQEVRREGGMCASRRCCRLQVEPRQQSRMVKIYIVVLVGSSGLVTLGARRVPCTAPMSAVKKTIRKSRCDVLLHFLSRTGAHERLKKRGVSLLICSCRRGVYPASRLLSCKWRNKMGLPSTTLCFLTVEGLSCSQTGFKASSAQGARLSPSRYVLQIRQGRSDSQNLPPYFFHFGAV